jgi:transposase
MMDQFRFWVGVDWGDERHEVCVLDAHRGVRLQRSVRHAGDEIAALIDELLALVGGDPAQLAVAIETPRGAIVETLIERGVGVFAINPKQLDRFRDRHTAAGAKDDRRDAFVLADSLRTDSPSFRRVLLGDPRIVELRELSRMHDELTAERVMLGNRLRDQVHRYFPQLLELGSIHDNRWLWTLLERAPTPEAARRLSVQTLRSILKQHRIRSCTAEHAREVLAHQSVHVAPGVVDAACQHVGILLPRLRIVHEQHARVARELATRLEGLASASETEPLATDVRILLSLPGIGPIVCATLLAEAWQPLAMRDDMTLRALCGLAPVTRSSGKSHLVCMRYACSARLRQAFHHWMMNAVQLDPRARAHYATLRARGQRHGRAVRGVGDRMLAVMLAMLKTGSEYDPSRRQLSRSAVTQPVQVAS